MTLPNTTAQSEHRQFLRLSELDASVCLELPIPSGWCALDDRGLIRVTGEDAESFLQGQLTQDMALVKKGQSLLAAHCNPKGRILSLFRCYFWQNQFFLDHPAALEAPALKRLTMYKLRAKVSLECASSLVSRTALWGNTMRFALQERGWEVSDQPGSTTELAEGLLSCLSKDRWVLLSSASYAEALRAQLTKITPKSDQGWQLTSVCAGEPEVLPLTVDTWIPQMLNLDQLQGVSFKKGCYTGQEIVARAHFLGRVKRRMRLFAYEGDLHPEPGQIIHFNIEDPNLVPQNQPAPTELQSTELDQESGNSAHVVRAVETQPGRGWLLAVTSLISNFESSSNENKL